MFRHTNLQSMSSNESHSESVRKTANSAIDIFIFSNGEENSPPRKYHLRSEELSWWDATRSYLARSHYGYINSGIDIFTLNGHKIEDPKDLLDGGVYVAVIPTDAFVEAGYDKYLIKASRSWEKRQQQKQLDDVPVPKPESSDQYGKWSNPGKMSASDVTQRSKTSEKLQPFNPTNPRSNLRNTSTRSAVNKSNDLTKRKNANLSDSFAGKSNTNRTFTKQTPIKSTSIIKKKESPLKINSRLYDPTKYKSFDTIRSAKNATSILTKQQSITKTNSSNNNDRKFVYEAVNKKKLSKNKLNSKIENISSSRRDSKSKSKVSIPEIYINPENDAQSTQIIEVNETERNTVVKLSTDPKFHTGLEVKTEKEEFKNILNHVVERVFAPKSTKKELKYTEPSENMDEISEVVLKKISQSSSIGIEMTDHYGESNEALANKHEVINLNVNIEVRNELAIPFPDNVNALESHRTEKVEKGSQVNVNIGFIASSMLEKNQNELEIKEKLSEDNTEITDNNKNKDLCYANTKPVIVYCCCTESDHVNSGKPEPVRAKNPTKKYILLTTTESSMHEVNETCTCGTECNCKAAHNKQPTSSTILPTRERKTITNIQSKPKIIELKSSEHCVCLSPDKDNQYIPRRLHTEKKDPSVFVSKTEIFGAVADVCWDEYEGFTAETTAQPTETNILKPVSTRNFEKSVFLPTDDIKNKHTYFNGKKTTLCPPCPCPTDFLIVKHVLKCTCSEDNINKYTVSKYSRATEENQKPQFHITKNETIEPSSVTEFLVMRKHDGATLVNASTQTDWSDILLEATINKDGRYSLHLPSLDTLRRYKV